MTISLMSRDGVMDGLFDEVYLVYRNDTRILAS